MSMRMKIGNVVWIIFLCVTTFVITAALWIRKTYGILSFAMADESFRNGLQNKRTLFGKYVILPTLIVFVLLLIVHIVYKKFNRQRAVYISAILMLLAACAAAMILDVGAYLNRRHRLDQVQWYDTDNVVVHALGKIDGATYTNSREALENSYEAGNRLLECDFIMTADNQIVACHDWEFWNRETNKDELAGEDYIPTLDVFMSRKVMGKYTPLSGEDIVQFLKAHPDMYIITDTKYSEPEEIKEEFQALVEVAKINNCEEVLDRFVVQIYHMYMYDIVDGIYRFPNYIFTLYTEGYRGEEDKMQQYAEFCMLHDIDVITMNAMFYQDGLLDICERYGVHMFVHTVNEEEEIKAYHEKGIGVYTDDNRRK